MKNAAILLLFLLPVNIVAAQRVIIDSLKKELLIAKTDTDRVLLGSELALYFLSADSDTALILAQQAYNLSEKIHYVKGQALALNRVASANQMLGDNAKCLMLFTKALKTSQNIADAEGIVRAYNNIGDMYLTMKDYTKALNYFIKAKALNYFIKEKAVAGKMDIGLSINIGVSYLHLKQYDSALRYLQTAEKMRKVRNSQGELELNLGDVQAALNHPEEALKRYRTSILLCNTLDDKFTLIATYLSMAKLYQHEKQQDSAVFYAKKAPICFETASYKKDFASLLLYPQLNKLSDSYRDGVRGAPHRLQAVRPSFRFVLGFYP